MSDDWNVLNTYKIEFSIDKDVRLNRISICEECEQLNTFKICKECNCIMPIKTWLKNKKCPLNRW